jgi:hypothetical protein
MIEPVHGTAHPDPIEARYRPAPMHHRFGCDCDACEWAEEPPTPEREDV